MRGEQGSFFKEKVGMQMGRERIGGKRGERKGHVRVERGQSPV